MMPFASIPVTPDTLYGTMGVLAFLLVIVEKVMSLIKGRNPQPFLVKNADKFLDRESYHVHCKINREEHERIEDDLSAQLKDLERQHNSLAREVTEVKTSEATTSARLIQMDAKLDKILQIAKS